MMIIFSNIIKKFNQFRLADYGSATVEFVVMLPLLVGILALAAESGRAYWKYHIVSQSVRDATRYLTRAPMNDAGTDIADGYITRSRNMILTGTASVTAGQPLYDWWMDPGTIAVTSSEIPDSESAFRTEYRVVQVTATVPVELPFMSLVNMFDGDNDASLTSINIVVQDQARHIGD